MTKETTSGRKELTASSSSPKISGWFPSQRACTTFPFPSNVPIVLKRQNGEGDISVCLVTVVPMFTAVWGILVGTAVILQYCQHSLMQCRIGNCCPMCCMHHWRSFYCEHTLWLLDTSYMMTSSNGNIFCVTEHVCGEFTGPRWIPRTKASDAELWCFLWSAPE